VLSANLVEPTETFTMNLSAPTNATLARAQGIGTILDRPPGPGLPTLSASDVTVTEGDSGTSPATFTVRLSAASTTPVTVSYATADGTALAGSDYVATSGTLTFAPGVTSQSVTVPIIGDRVAEPTETFRLVFSNSVGATLSTVQATGTILDNDSPPPGVTPSFSVSSDWGTGFTAGITLTNNTSAAINGWTLEFDFDRTITNIWNAQIVSRVGNHYVIRAMSYNQSIAANGGSVSFGFQGATGNVTSGPTNWTLNGLPIH
jgi:chitinase